MADETFAEVVEDHFPYDGPHTPETVVNAARGISALVRYLNNATGPGNGAESLRYGPTAWRLLGSLNTTTTELDQLLEQLADALNQRADDPTMYDDRGSSYPAADTARDAASRISEARRALSGPQQQIAAAWAESGHLGHNL